MASKVLMLQSQCIAANDIVINLWLYDARKTQLMCVSHDGVSKEFRNGIHSLSETMLIFFMTYVDCIEDADVRLRTIRFCFTYISRANKHPSTCIKCFISHHWLYPYGEHRIRIERGRGLATPSHNHKIYYNLSVTRCSVSSVQFQQMQSSVVVTRFNF